MDIAPNLLLEYAQTNVNEDDADVIVTGVDCDSGCFRYHPVDSEWQKRQCQRLGLVYRGPNDVSRGPNVQLSPPNTFKAICGDGNCLFQALSFIITGSEDQHLSMRSTIVQHMREIGDMPDSSTSEAFIQLVKSKCSAVL